MFGVFIDIWSMPAPYWWTDNGCLLGVSPAIFFVQKMFDISAKMWTLFAGSR
jgi:hypothetical protein